MSGDNCNSIWVNVEIQENGIIRDNQGILIGRLVIREEAMHYERLKGYDPVERFGLIEYPKPPDKPRCVGISACGNCDPNCPAH